MAKKAELKKEIELLKQELGYAKLAAEAKDEQIQQLEVELALERVSKPFVIKPNPNPWPPGFPQPLISWIGGNSSFERAT